MPFLNIAYSGGGYELYLANGERLDFILGLDNEAQAVQLFAEAMTQGIDQVIGSSEYIFQSGAQFSDAFVEGIFEGADSLYLGGAAIFETEEGMTLLEVIEEVGTALLEALL